MDIYDPETKEFQSYCYSPENSNSLSFNFITNLFEDKAGNIWISTFSGGLNKYTKQRSNIVTFPSEHFKINNKSNLVVSAIEIEPNKLLLGTYYGLGIHDLSNNRFEPLKLHSSKPFIIAPMISITRDEEGSFWFGTVSKGVGKVNFQQFSYKTYTPKDKHGLSDCNINSLTCDQDGVVWVGTVSAGICRYNKKTDSFQVFTNIPDDPTSLSSNRVRLLFVDSKNNLWAGTEDGLNLFDRSTLKFKHFHHVSGDPSTISGNIISGIVEDQNGILWVGTLSNGLNRLDPSTGTFSRLGDKFSVLNNQIKNLLVDDHNCLWITAVTGLFRYNIKDSFLSAFDENDGLMSNDFLETVPYKMKNGKLIFFSNNAMNLLDPTYYFEKKNDPQIVLTDFKVFGKSKEFEKDISEISNISLNYTENYFTIEFASLDLRNSSKINYSYKMEGVDKDWIDCGKTKICRIYESKRR